VPVADNLRGVGETDRHKYRLPTLARRVPERVHSGALPGP
jgi:hypothetical protein